MGIRRLCSSWPKLPSFYFFSLCAGRDRFQGCWEANQLVSATVSYVGDILPFSLPGHPCMSLAAGFFSQSLMTQLPPSLSSRVSVIFAYTLSSGTSDKDVLEHVHQRWI